MRVLSLIFILVTNVTSVVFAETPTFKIGLILPLSGVVADYGYALRSAIEMAQHDHPERFKHISLIYEDAQYDPKSAVNAFHKLVQRDRVDLVYTWGVAFCKVLSPLADRYKVPVVGQCIDKYSSQNRQYFIRFQNYSDQYMQKQLEFLKAHQIKRIAVFLADNGYLEELYEALKRNATSDIQIELIERLSPQEMDLRHALSRLKLGNYDAVAVFLMAGQISQYYRQAKEREITLPTFGSNLFESQSEISTSRGAMNGVWVASNLITNTFQSRYRKANGSENQIGFASLAYEFTTLIGELFSTPLQYSEQEIVQKFMSVGPREGIATGAYYPRESAEAGKFFEFELMVKEIEGDHFKPVR